MHNSLEFVIPGSEPISHLQFLVLARSSSQLSLSPSSKSFHAKTHFKVIACSLVAN